MKPAQQLSLELARAEGERGMRAAEAAGERIVPSLTLRASSYMYALLVEHKRNTGEGMTGEELTVACIAAGFAVKPQALGQAFKRLTSIGGRVVGMVPRTRGHGSAGGKLYSA